MLNYNGFGETVNHAYIRNIARCAETMTHLPQPERCPLCQSSWIGHNHYFDCSNKDCRKQFDTQLTVARSPKTLWKWYFSVSVNRKALIWYSDGRFWNNGHQNYYPEITVSSIQTILSFS